METEMPGAMLAGTETGEVKAPATEMVVTATAAEMVTTVGTEATVVMATAVMEMPAALGTAAVQVAQVVVTAVLRGRVRAALSVEAATAAGMETVAPEPAIAAVVALVEAATAAAAAGARLQ